MRQIDMDLALQVSTVLHVSVPDSLIVDGETRMEGRQNWGVGGLDGGFVWRWTEGYMMPG